MECCGAETLKNRNCPICNEKGSLVQLVTVKSLLLNKFINLISEKDIYYFCKNPKCEVVYFNKESKLFNKYDLKEKVTQKFEDLDAKTCFCFNVTKGDIVAELKETGDCNVVDVIKAKMKDPGCFCETSNPQGSCCLAINSEFINDVRIKLKRG